jgi:sterol desaturase/sphingolipid hydroxylase (fatty acid hydroxylase superfamily)
LPELSPQAWDVARRLLLVWAFHFSFATLISYLAKGSAAFRWSSKLVRSARVNWAFLATNMLSIPVQLMIGGALYYGFHAMGAPSIPTSTWSAVPFVVQVAFAFVLMDFVEYWEHRIKHKSFLWPLHAVHHSETEMNYMTSKRLHVVDGLLHHTMIVLLGLTIGLEYVSIALIMSLRELHQFYVHMNIDWTHGPLEKWIASPRYHRWHHANVPAAYDKNFGLVMPIWDHLFGTYYCPGPCDEEMGFDDSPGDGFLTMMVFPFRAWGRMIRDSVLARESR